MRESLSAGNLGCEKQESVPTEIEQLVLNFQSKLAQLGKAVDYQKDEFRKIDAVATKLNGENYYKNVAQEIDCSDNGGKMSAPEPHRSGIVLRLYNSINELDLITRQIDNFTNDEIKKTVNFFKEQI